MFYALVQNPGTCKGSCLANWYTMAFLVDTIHADRTKQQRDNTARGSVDGGQNAVYQYSHDSHRQNNFTCQIHSLYRADHAMSEMGLRLGESFPCWKVVGAGVCLAFSCFFPVDIGTFWMSQLTHGLTHEDRHEQDGTDTHRKEFRLCGSVVLF